MVLWGRPAQRTTVSAVVRSREKAVPVVALHVLRHGVQRQRLSFHAWIPIVHGPMWPRAGYATLGQHVVVGSMLLLRDAWGNLPGGVWLAPRLRDKCTSPRLSGELPAV